MTDRNVNRAPHQYPCMMCEGPALDSPVGGETEWEWIDGKRVSVAFWVYCRKCDCWTSHPLVDTEAKRE